LAASLPPAPIAATLARARNLVRPRFVRTQMNGGRMVFGNVTAGITICTAWALESRFDLVRLVYGNDQATGIAIDGVSAAVSAKLNDGINPVDSAGAARAFTRFTFNNAGADGAWPSPSGSANTLAATATTADALNPAFTFTDWVQLASLDRADAGETLPLLFTRTYRVAAGRENKRSTTYAADWNTAAVNLGRIRKSAYRLGDQTGGAVVTTGFTTDSGVYSPCFVQYYSRGPGATVLCIGDSYTEGLTTRADARSWGHIACAQLSTAGFPISCFNGGFSGQTSAAYHTRGKTLIEAIKPEICFIALWSPNDGSPTTALVDAAWGRAMALAHRVRELGGIPILTGPLPLIPAAGASSQAARDEMMARLRAAQDAQLWVDHGATVGDGATPVKLAAAFDSGDGGHPNEAGHAALAAPTVAAIRKALGL